MNFIHTEPQQKGMPKREIIELKKFEKHEYPDYFMGNLTEEQNLFHVELNCGHRLFFVSGTDHEGKFEPDPKLHDYLSCYPCSREN